MRDDSAHCGHCVLEHWLHWPVGTDIRNVRVLLELLQLTWKHLEGCEALAHETALQMSAEVYDLIDVFLTGLGIELYDHVDMLAVRIDF